MPLSTIFQLYRGGQFFIDGGNRRIRRKPLTCRKSLTTISHIVVHLALIEIQTHKIRSDRHWLHR